MAKTDATSATLHNELAEGPANGQAWWLHADDGLRLRVAHWPGGPKGTVFLLPGRTEYIEKYGRAAADLVARGYGTLTIDWRGQGFADRMLPNRRLGHVEFFSDYQRDFRALLEHAARIGAPRPFYLIGHSMGGCIGLRSLHEHGAEFEAAAFSGPMWGIGMAAHMRPIAWALSTSSTTFGLGGFRVPGTSPEAYVLEAPFEDNMLTSDPDMFEYMVRQTRALPDVELCGPTLNWLAEALRETKKLRALGPTPHPVVTALGGNERIVDPRHVHLVMDRWTNGKLIMCEGAEHEIIMEIPPTRALFFDEADALFQATSSART